MRNVIDIAEKQWVKIASSIRTGYLRIPRGSGAFTFFYTIRTPGALAPTDKEDNQQALQLFEGRGNSPIAASEPIDIYVWAENSDSDSNDIAKIILDV